jgi:N-acetylglucosaminyldiphosphoundecaprenol N-acetyl-beta-D-mannosaminyltransferase
MKEKYFEVYLEFDRKCVNEIICESIEQKKKGYVCLVDGNVLTTTYYNLAYKNVVNGSLVNLCDGSSIALLINKIHKKKISTFTGPEIFAEYVIGNYKQYFLGNTENNLISLLNRFSELGYDIEQFKFQSLPFRNVDDFDYITIAKEINEFSPDIIWVSLGAPKQEIFISKLYPYIDKGILFAIGAAFILFLDDNQNKRAPLILRQIHLEWLYRVIQEPKRVGKRAFRYLIILPKLIYEERKLTK